MVICPQCQFKNSSVNKFCQNCGEPLVLWWAIVRGAPGAQKFYLSEERVGDSEARSLALSVKQVHNHADQGETPEAADTMTASDEAILLPPFLDVKHRYRCLSTLSVQDYLSTSEDGLSWEIQTQVVDYQFSEKTPFSDLAQELSATELEAFLGNSQISSQIQPYLGLKARFKSTVPKIHDAWQHEGQDILLLEDRSHWQPLSTFCEQECVPTMQILHWLHEMIELWIELEPWCCQRSLQELSNLRVDEDGMLGLQRLYFDPLPRVGVEPLQLRDLGQMWRQLFQQSEGLLEEQLDQLIDGVCTGVITSATDLQLMLEEMAYEAQQQDLLTAKVQENLEQQSMVLAEAAVSWEDEEDSLDDAQLPTVVLPMKLNDLDVSALTDVGKQREHNEDFFGVITQTTQQETPERNTLQAKGLYILCDGMGGHAGGEVASALAVETLQKFFQTRWQDTFPDQATIHEAVIAANEAIYAVNQQRASSGIGRMGTTLVLVLLQDTEVAVAHVGDSRLYRLSRKRGLEQLTLDHEVGQREIQRGVEPEIAYARPDAYQLTQALGPRESELVKPEIQFFSVREDMLLLLCSDGLTDNDLLESYWQSHLMPLLSSQANLEQGMRQLIDLANQYNGHDNTTAIAIRIKVMPDLTLLLS